jgi:trehalose/maltose hydrolase-like predicted phosphorylase
VRTSQSHVHVAQVARTQFFLDGRQLEVQRQVIKEPNYIGQELTIDIKQGEMLAMEKLVFLYTSRDQAISECGLEARKAMVRAGRFDAVKADHVLAWAHLWRRFDVRIEPAEPGFKLNVPMLLRLNMFHLLQTVSLHSIGLDIGVPPRGWTGEAYQGHVFGMNYLSFHSLTFVYPRSLGPC